MTAKKIGGIALAVAALLLVASSAGAVVIKGVGELRAAGNGAGVLEFRGQGTFVGVGLAVVEHDALVSVRGNGNATPLPGGRVLLEGFGRITVRSLDNRTRVEIAGAHLRLRVRGAGIAILKGVGHVSTDDLDESWTDERIFEFEEGVAE